jgi:hypothetical protein
MQFKRPFAHTVPSRANIIKDRNNLSPKLAIAPRTLYFSLQDKQKHHKDFQHNVLYRLRQKLLGRGIGDAAYVCPLFLDRQTYFLHAHMAGLKSWVGRWPSRPYDRRSVVVTSRAGKHVQVNIPVLAEHISVPPHATVTTAAHKYSFTEQGDEVCFHSPKYLPEGSFLLSEWLGELAVAAESADSLLYSGDSRSFLSDLVTETLGEGQSEFELPRDPSHAWYAWGNFLQRHYAIEQYGIIVDEP